MQIYRRKGQKNGLPSNSPTVFVTHFAVSELFAAAWTSKNPRGKKDGKVKNMRETYVKLHAFC